jgi:hypothetical protein
MADPETAAVDVVVLVYPDHTELRVVITSVAELPYLIAAALHRWTRDSTP